MLNFAFAREPVWGYQYTSTRCQLISAEKILGGQETSALTLLFSLSLNFLLVLLTDDDDDDNDVDE